LGTGAESSPVPSPFLARVTGVFASPTRTFESVARHPRFFAPFLATLIFLGGFWGVVYLKLGLSGMAVAVVQYFRRGTQVTQNEIEVTLQFSRALAPAVLVGGAIAILVHLLVIAWVGARVTDLFFGARVKLRVALSVACYAYLAKTIAQTTLGIPMVLFGDAKGLNFGNLVPTNIAFFLDPKDMSRTFYAFLQSLDFVQLWYFALLGIGLSRDSDDASGPVAIGVSLAALWIAWNVFFGTFKDFLMGG
jgi:hypothetical protein